MNGFLWQYVGPHGRFDTRCHVVGDVVLPAAVHLGTPESELLQTLGTPTTRKAAILLYLHEHEQPIRGEPFTTTNTLTIVLTNGKVSTIEVWKTTAS